ncbi:Uncharacterised protein [Vibrio cholerae]|nr:Uncharacterised protein [Vibrio cholerae]
MGSPQTPSQNQQQAHCADRNRYRAALNTRADHPQTERFPAHHCKTESGLIYQSTLGLKSAHANHWGYGAAKLWVSATK